MIVSSDKNNVSVMIVTDGIVSIANIDNLRDGRWWVSRVKVQGTEKGKGTGSKMLKKAIEEVLSYGKTEIIVAPGGYDSNTEKQYNFYKKNGFVESDEKGMLIYKQ